MLVSTLIPLFVVKDLGCYSLPAMDTISSRSRITKLRALNAKFSAPLFNA
jgi:hypothetical protein